jgi:hypothetical protein
MHFDLTRGALVVHEALWQHFHWSIIPRDGQSRKVTWELAPATTTLPCPPPELKLQGSCYGNAISMATWLQQAQLECSEILKGKKIRFQTCMCKIHKPVRWRSIHAFSLKCPKLWQCHQLMKKTRNRVHLHPGMQSRGGPVSQTIPQKLPCRRSIQFYHICWQRNCHGRIISTATTKPNISETSILPNTIYLKHQAHNLETPKFCVLGLGFTTQTLNPKIHYKIPWSSIDWSKHAFPISAWNRSSWASMSLHASKRLKRHPFSETPETN